MSTPKVSILIPTYNRVDLLPRALMAARKQTYPNIEVVVYDDASTDGTSDYVRHVQSHDERVVYRRGKANKGEGGARNELIAMATGDYGCWLDSDDMCSMFRVAAQLSVMLELEPSVLHCGIRSIKSSYKKFPERAKRLMWSRVAATPTAMFSLEKAKQVAYEEDLAFGVDKVWEMRMRASHGNSVLLPLALYGYVRKAVGRLSTWISSPDNKEVASAASKQRSKLIWELIAQVKERGGRLKDQYVPDSVMYRFYKMVPIK